MGHHAERFSKVYENEYLPTLNEIGDKYGVVFKEHGCWDETFDKWFCTAYAESKLGNEFKFFMDIEGIDNIGYNVDCLFGGIGAAFQWVEVADDREWAKLTKAAEIGDEYRMGELKKYVCHHSYFTLSKEGEESKKLDIEHNDDDLIELEDDIRELETRLRACGKEIWEYCEKEANLIRNKQKSLLKLYPI